MTLNVGYVLLGAILVVANFVILGRARSGVVRLVAIILLAIGIYLIMLGFGLVVLPSFPGGNVTSTTPTNSTSTTSSS